MLSSLVSCAPCNFYSSLRQDRKLFSTHPTLLKADEILQHPESRAVDSFSLCLRGIREARETTERAGVQRVTDAAASEVPGADWVWPGAHGPLSGSTG